MASIVVLKSITYQVRVHFDVPTIRVNCLLLSEFGAYFVWFCFALRMQRFVSHSEKHFARFQSLCSGLHYYGHRHLVSVRLSGPINSLTATFVYPKFKLDRDKYAKQLMHSSDLAVSHQAIIPLIVASQTFFKSPLQRLAFKNVPNRVFPFCCLFCSRKKPKSTRTNDLVDKRKQHFNRSHVFFSVCSRTSHLTSAGCH